MIEVSQKEGVLILTINRPEVLNALNISVMNTLKTYLVNAEHDASVKVIVITGKGEKAFVAGADINEFLSLKDENEAKDYSQLGQSVFSYIASSSKPVICAINGYALGGGLELALACDIRFASENAKFGFPEIKLGLYPGYGGAQRFPRLVGKGMALYLMMSGELFSSKEAERIGLIEKVVQSDSLMDNVLNFAQKISQYPSEAMTQLKKSVNNGTEIHIDEALKIDATNIGLLMVSNETKQRTKKFLGEN